MSDDAQLLAQARSRVLALRERLQQREGAPVRLVETHISWVLLGESLAYKIKKPVLLPFVDFRGLDMRQRCCAEELRLNCRLAPEIYRGVVEVRAGPDGPDFDGDGPVVDFAVCMNRFADGSLWSERLAAGQLDGRQVEAMARRLAEFHDRAEVMPVDSRFGSAAVHQGVTDRLLDAMDAWAGGHTACGAGEADLDWPPLRAWLLEQSAALVPFWDERRSAGRVREGHGDLHLANLIQRGEVSTAFDAIDFDPELRCIDVLEDLAFLVMDLLANGANELAWRLLGVYLECSGDYVGLPGFRFYLVRRALVRAQVKDLSVKLAAAAAIDVSHAASGCDADGYRRLAARLAFGANPRLAITHGLPASGKSHVAQQLVVQAGAIRLRSDVERKRLFGLGALENSRLLGNIYTQEATERTYRRLFELAQGGLRAGWPMVVDAAFLRRAERLDFAALAASMGLPFSIVDCRAPPSLLRERIRRRRATGMDPSEADESILEMLRQANEPLDVAEEASTLSVDTTDPTSAEGIAARWLAAGSA